MNPEILATSACGMFAGAAVYVSLVEHPARLSCGTRLALAEWKARYKPGAVMHTSLAMTGSVLSILAWWLDKNAAWLIGGALLFAVVPFTLIVIFPTNRQLESDELDLSSNQTENLLYLWGRLHAVRSGLSFLAFVIFLIALTRRP